MLGACDCDRKVSRKLFLDAKEKGLRDERRENVIRETIERLDNLS